MISQPVFRSKSRGPDNLPPWFQRLALTSLDFVGRSAPAWFHTYAAVAGLIECQQHLLTIERADGRGLGLPGGLLRWRESAIAGLAREVLEETGYAIAARTLFNVYSTPERDDRLGAVVIVYVGQIISGQTRHSPEGRVHWLDLQHALPPMAFQDELIVHEFLATQIQA